MTQNKRQQLIEQLKQICQSSDTRLNIIAPAGQVTIKKSEYINAMLDFLIKEIEQGLPKTE